MMGLQDVAAVLPGGTRVPQPRLDPQDASVLYSSERQFSFDCAKASTWVAKAQSQGAAAVGVVEHGNSVFLVTMRASGELLDRRRVDLTRGLPTHPYHHEGSWAVGRYLNSSWSRAISLPEAVALVERVRQAAAEGAHASLDALTMAVSVPIGCIAIRKCPALPQTTEERIVNTRAANVADSVMYREALATAAGTRGWAVHWYDRKCVFRDAASAVGGQDIDAFLRELGRSAGPPWQATHRMAAAAALAAGARSQSPPQAPQGVPSLGR